MRQLVIAALVILAFTAAVAQRSDSSVSPVGVWRWQDRDIDWVYAPKELKQRGGVATIARFSSSGQFALVYGVIYQENGREIVSQGDSWTLFYGTWRNDHGRILVSYSPYYIDIPRIENGRLTCPLPVKDRPISIEHGRLLFENRVLVRAKKLEPSFNSTFPGPKDIPKSCGTFERGQPESSIANK